MGEYHGAEVVFEDWLPLVPVPNDDCELGSAGHEDVGDEGVELDVIDGRMVARVEAYELRGIFSGGKVHLHTRVYQELPVLFSIP